MSFSGEINRKLLQMNFGFRWTETGLSHWTGNVLYKMLPRNPGITKIPGSQNSLYENTTHSNPVAYSRAAPFSPIYPLPVCSALFSQMLATVC